MTLRFTNLREPARFAELDPIQRRQLAVCARLYFGDEEVPIAARLGGDGEDPEAAFCFVELWDVEQDGAHAYDAFLYNVDSGTVFKRGTTEVVAERIQCYFDQAADEALEAALQAGYHAACKARRGEAQAAATKKASPAKKVAAKKASGGKTAAAKRR